MPVTTMKVKNTVESLRDIVQDLLVPELKSVKTSVESLRNEMKISFDAVHMEMKLRDEKLTGSIENLSQTLTLAIRHLGENQKQLSDRLDKTLEIRERLAALEERGKRD